MQCFHRISSVFILVHLNTSDAAHSCAQLQRIAPLFIQFAPLPIRINADLHPKPRNPAQFPPIARVCTPFSLALVRLSGFSLNCIRSYSIPVRLATTRRCGCRHFIIFCGMDFEDHQERLKQRLQSAPKRERAPCVAPLLRSMRDEIAKVAEEKNLSYKDIQQMLAADGLTVSISTLSRHLGAKRKGREEDRKAALNATNANGEPAPSAPERISMPPDTALTNGGKRTTGGEARPVPPMPSPFASTIGATKPKGPPDPAVPRASSFPIRRDREQI